MNAFIQDTREHGIFNTKFTAVNNSTTEQSMGIDLSSSSYDINCAIRKAGSTGDVEWLSTASAIKITMPTGTWSAQIAGITITGAYDFYKYVVSDNGTIRTMISRSPYHKSVPANYYHTISATGMTAVGSPSTAWDAAFLSGSGAINATNSCVCLGLIGTITINGTTGLASASTLATGAIPAWDSQPDTRPEPYTATWNGITVSSQNCKIWFSGRGTVQHFDIQAVVSGSSAAEARASLPVAARSDLPTLSTVGGGGATNAVQYIAALAEPSVAYITFGYAGAFSLLVKRNGNDFVNSSSTLSVCGRVEI